MNKIKSFTIYEEYYELITLLNQREQEEFLLAIVRYMFEDVEPVLNDKQQKIFNNLKRPLDVSKNKSKNARKENQVKIKRKSNENQNEIKKEIKRGNTSKMLMSMSNVNVIVKENIDKDKHPDLYETLKNWFTYKKEKNQFYKETGLKSLLTQIKNNVDKFGEEAVNEVINNSMANNYTGIIFDNLKKTKTTYGKKEDTVPEWFDKKITIKKPSEEKRKEMEKLLKEYQK